MLITNFTSSEGVCMELMLASYLQKFTETISQTLKDSFCLQRHSEHNFNTLLPDDRCGCQRLSFPEHTFLCSCDTGDRQEPE